eukprot:Transcript_31413.p1 GENE.Transcript_31413~~Transcript_31413.p1  ORF type:complete len:198 (-),score=8.35 Transcript_31413:449-1042(-)
MRSALLLLQLVRSASAECMAPAGVAALGHLTCTMEECLANQTMECDLICGEACCSARLGRTGCASSRAGVPMQAECTTVADCPAQTNALCSSSCEGGACLTMCESAEGTPGPNAACPAGCVEGFHENGGCAMWNAGSDPAPAIPSGCELGCEEAAREHCTSMGLPPADSQSGPARCTPCALPSLRRLLFASLPDHCC